MAISIVKNQMIINMQKIALAIGVCFAFFSQPMYSQGSRNVYEAYANLVRKEYGLDHDLVNGVQYYNRHTRAQGHPYFYENNMYQLGSLTLEGREYPDLLLKFDAFYQHVEIQYRSFSGGINQMIPVVDKVDAFTLGPYHFQKLELEKGEEKFYQVLATACFTCYIHWEKDLLPMTGSFSYVEQFSEAKRSMWLDLNGELKAFSSRKEFAGLFPEEDRKDIKRLLSRAQFKFRTAPVEIIVRQVDAVCKLLEKKETP